MRIVIVEDELKSLQGIEKLSHELGEGFVVAGCAKNGQDGLEMIRSLQPDIVLTDIKMPVLSGLEMIKELTKGECRSKFIILSGYAEFNYAQEAIKLGSVDYLLKPVTREVLFKALKHAQELLEGEAEIINPKRYTNDELLLRVIATQGEHCRELLTELEKRLGTRDKWGICVLRSDVRIRAADHMQICHILESLKPEAGYGVCFRENKRECDLLFRIGKDDKVFSYLEAVKMEIERAIPMEFVISYCRFQKGEDFHSLLEKAREQTNWHLSLPDNPILHEETVQKLIIEKLIYPTNKERKIIEKIYAGRMEEVRQEIDEFMDFLTEKTYDYKEIREAVICMTVALLYAIRQSSYGIYDEINHLNILDWIKDKLILNSVRNMLTNMIGELERYQNSVKSASHPLVKKVLKLIENDYRRDISVEEVADLLHITPEYLGTLFTKELGIKFTVYCTQKRIGYAKELFRSRESKVYEVAQECGYMDVKYFCKVFKKFTGKSPSDYQHSFNL